MLVKEAEAGGAGDYIYDLTRTGCGKMAVQAAMGQRWLRLA